MDYLTLGVGSYLFFLILRIYRKHFHQVAERSLSLLNALLSSESDEEKLKSLQSSTSKLVFSLGKTLLVVFISLLVALIPFVCLCLITGSYEMEIGITSFSGIAAVSIGSLVAFYFPKLNKDRGEYSELSKLLHRLILDNQTIHYKLFKREVKKRRKKKIGVKNEFLIVSGLARAGTTSLLNHLEKHPSFQSLDYSSMPFLLAPNTWKRFHNPKKAELKERSHNDGIQIGLNSNEALEEHFFKVIKKDEFVLESSVKKHEINPEQLDDYLNYQTLIREKDSDIYLAKNNNFLLRYESLRKQNSDFKMLILFREPLSHASSLMEKHKQYSKMQTEDPFVLEYMNWLGHYEFGLGQKPFDFGNIDGIDLPKDQLDYWLQRWIEYYEYALMVFREELYFIQYEAFCSSPNEVLESILSEFSFSQPLQRVKPHVNGRKVEVKCSPELKDKASRIYDELTKLFSEKFELN